MPKREAMINHSLINVKKEFDRLSFQYNEFKSNQEDKKNVAQLWNKLKTKESRLLYLTNQTFLKPSSEAYKCIWYRSPNASILTKSMHLLSDYTKDNSLILRFFTFHWGRNHIKEVNSIVEGIKNQDISSTDQLIEALDNIQLKNPKGSLARRFEFILANIIHSSQSEKLKNKQSLLNKTSVK